MRVMEDKATAGRRRGRRGSALVAALLAASTLLTLGVALAGVAVRDNQLTSTEVSDRAAFVLAEAGIAEALAARSIGGSGGVGSDVSPVYLDGGLFWVETEDLGGGATRLVASAMKGSGRAAVEVIVRESSLWGNLQGISSLETPITKTGAFFDSYDSRDGSYASQVGAGGYAGTESMLQTNGDIDLKSNSSIYGDVEAPGSISLGAGTHVSGSTTTSSGGLVLPPVDVPAIPVTGDYTASGTTTLGPGSYGFEDVLIKRAATLTIEGPATIYVSGDFEMKRSDLIIDASGGPVKLFLEGDFSNATMATITTPGPTPGNFSIFLVGDEDQRMDLHPHGELHGTIYAPNATVDLGTDLELFGAVAARMVEMQPHNSFHFDMALLDDEVDEVSLPQLLYWASTDLGRMPASGRGDPFAIYGVSPEDLVGPGEAWADVDHGGDGDG